MSNVSNNTTKHISNKTKLRSRGRWLLISALLLITASQNVQAGFIGDYALSKFTVQNSQADGLASLDALGSLVITGGNNGSGLSGFTDVMITAPAAGSVSFAWKYFSNDLPPYDLAGYIVGPLVHLLSDTSGESGIVSFNVAANQTFGFRIGTEDNTHEPGVLTISDFTAPAAQLSSVPEPNALSLSFGGLLLIVATGGFRRRRNHKGT